MEKPTAKTHQTVAEHIGEDVTLAIGKYMAGQLKGTTAVCGAYLIEVVEYGGEIVVSARTPRSLLRG